MGKIILSVVRNYKLAHRVQVVNEIPVLNKSTTVSLLICFYYTYDRVALSLYKWLFHQKNLPFALWMAYPTLLLRDTC